MAWITNPSTTGFHGISSVKSPPDGSGPERLTLLEYKQGHMDCFIVNDSRQNMALARLWWHPSNMTVVQLI